MAFKMKGNPIKRNFGIGASPTKQMSKPMDPPAKQFEEGDYYDTKTSKKKSPAKDYSMSKGSHNHPHSPAKQSDEQEKTDERLGKGIFNKPADEKSPNKQTEVREGEEYKNKEGKTQKEILEMRNENIKTADEKGKTYKKKVDDFSKKEGGLTESQAEAANKKIADLNKNLKNMMDLYTHSSDSITNVNRNIDINKKKREDDSGLFAKSPYKQFEEGDYYDTRSKKRKKK